MLVDFFHVRYEKFLKPSQTELVKCFLVWHKSGFDIESYKLEFVFALT